ncbi:efflux RND transporter periplasmic adaptor subunit [Methylomonas sp. AM2-LC]|uniref:efflux RND transporter periplasmic adaptor subunit n=1 Tax=Methylomonas sp. AM2-LC TaxID=3153301 RepID=UPI00326385C2
MSKGKYNATLCIASFIIALALTTTPCAYAEEKPSHTATKPSLNVNVVRPQYQSIPVQILANGSIAAWQEAIIGAEVSDLHLNEVAVQVGDNVRKGQVLATFADETVSTDVAKSRAALAEAEANLADAQLNAKRAEAVNNSGAISQLQIAQYLTTQKTALAKVQSAKAQLDAQLIQLKYTRVLAIDDGVISSRTATLGAVANKGQELFRMIRQNRLEWRGEVTASEMVKIKPGLPVSVIVTGVGTVKGKVRTLAPALDNQTRNGLVYVDLPAATAQGMRAGMFGTGHFQLDTTQGLTVPQTAVSFREGFSYVFRVGEAKDNVATVSQLKVQVGRQQDNTLEIVSGISANDNMVASGTTFLNDGDSVRLVQP